MNKDAKYEITEVHMTGVSINKFTVRSVDDDKKAFVTYDDAIKLACGNKLRNVSAFLDLTSGSYILDFEDGISSIPLHKGTELTLLYRMIDKDKKCVGYKARDLNGKTYKLSILKAWELASLGAIKGVTAKILYGKKSIISNDGKLLSELPILTD